MAVIGQAGVPRRPVWMNYVYALLIQAALTALLVWLYPYFPLGKFPAPYAAALLFTVLVLGEGPAILALALSLPLFHYFFVAPTYSMGAPMHADAYARTVAYILVNGIVVAAVSVIQRARRRAEHFARSLQEHAQLLDLAHVLIRDKDDRIIVWNTGLEALYGFTKQEALGRVPADLFKTSFPESRQAIDECLQKTGHWEGELVHVAKDGGTVVVASHQVLHRDDNGDPVAVLEVNNDITGRVQAQRALEKALQDLAVVNEDKEMMNEELRASNEELRREVLQRTVAEEELRKSESLLRAVTDGTPTPIFLKDCQSRWLIANPATLDVVGKSADEVLGRNDAEIYDDLEVGRGLVENDRRIMEAGEIETIEETVRGPDGPRVFQSLKVPWRNADGEVVGLLGVATDITDRKRAEREREMTVEFLQVINKSQTTAGLLSSSVSFFKAASGCEAVGIRLRNDHDYPYFQTSGFSEDHVRAECSLRLQNEDRHPVHDADGRPVFKCMCGSVIHGRIDPSKPFFTARGSFWTNSTSELSATSSEIDAEALERSMCNREGYESMALLPIHVGDDRLGLLQLSDRRTGMFSEDAIGLWERFADYLAVALAKFMAEEALHDSEAHKREFYRQTILAATDGKLVISEPEEIKRISGDVVGTWRIAGIDDIGVVREEATAAARAAGMDSSRICDFMACVVESTANAAKHARQAVASLHERDGSLVFVVSDTGPGIGPMQLPDVALTRGYTTAGTLGMGYKVMVSFADKVYLATGPDGTSVACEMARHSTSDTSG